MNCCSTPKVCLVREKDGHRICLSCKAHEYMGLIFSRRQWDAMMEDRQAYLAALGLPCDE